VASERLSRAEKQAQTRRALVDAAQTVFLKRGFTGASVEAIAAEAGFTRGAFYSNFASKEELFVALLKDRMYSYFERMTARRLADPDHLPSLRETGEELAQLQRDPESAWLFRLFLEVLAHASRHEELRALPAEFWSELRSSAAEITARAFASAGKPPPADPKLLATAMIALNMGLTIQRYVDPDAVPLEAWPELFEVLFPPVGEPAH
jgi:AcrR family transcriptional regulator